MAKINKEDYPQTRWGFFAYIFDKHFVKVLATLFSFAIILNLADIKISDLIKKVVDMIF